MIHSKTMHYHLKLFGFISIRFSRDVHYFEPYEKQATECKPCKPNGSDDILSDDANTAMDKHNHRHEKTLDALAVKNLEG